VCSVPLAELVSDTSSETGPTCKLHFEECQQCQECQRKSNEIGSVPTLAYFKFLAFLASLASCRFVAHYSAGAFGRTYSEFAGSSFGASLTPGNSRSLPFGSRS